MEKKIDYASWLLGSMFGLMLFLIIASNMHTTLAFMVSEIQKTTYIAASCVMGYILILSCIFSIKSMTEDKIFLFIGVVIVIVAVSIPITATSFKVKAQPEYSYAAMVLLALYVVNGTMAFFALFMHASIKVPDDGLYVHQGRYVRPGSKVPMSLFYKNDLHRVGPNVVATVANYRELKDMRVSRAITANFAIHWQSLDLEGQACNKDQMALMEADLKLNMKGILEYARRGQTTKEMIESLKYFLNLNVKELAGWPVKFVDLNVEYDIKA